MILQNKTKKSIVVCVVLLCTVFQAKPAAHNGGDDLIGTLKSNRNYRTINELCSKEGAPLEEAREMLPFLDPLMETKAEFIRFLVENQLQDKRQLRKFMNEKIEVEIGIRKKHGLPLGDFIVYRKLNKLLMENISENKSVKQDGDSIIAKVLESKRFKEISKEEARRKMQKN